MFLHIFSYLIFFLCWLFINKLTHQPRQLWLRHKLFTMASFYHGNKLIPWCPVCTMVSTCCQLKHLWTSFFSQIVKTSWWLHFKYVSNLLFRLRSSWDCFWKTFAFAMLNKLMHDIYSWQLIDVHHICCSMYCKQSDCRWSFDNFWSVSLARVIVDQSQFRCRAFFAFHFRSA